MGNALITLGIIAGFAFGVIMIGCTLLTIVYKIKERCSWIDAIREVWF